ncbi:MAG: hypothetical protein LBF67_09240 [Prevotellaceae bacterium]|jgi:hypothetical protein|nr:hypothetical protein [Prevotellaceae bacterium]
MNRKYLLIMQILFMSMIFQSCDSGRHIDKTQWHALMGANGEEFFLLTKEQQQEKLKILKLCLENTQVAGDSLVFSCTRSDFIEQGLPGEYYDFCLSDIQDINNFPSWTAELKQEFLSSYNASRDSSLQKVKALMDD